MALWSFVVVARSSCACSCCFRVREVKLVAPDALLQLGLRRGQRRHLALEVALLLLLRVDGVRELLLGLLLDELEHLDGLVALLALAVGGLAPGLRLALDRL